jgi:HlyD family secretion protein
MRRLTLNLLLMTAACAPEAPADRIRASGYIEATEVQVAAEVGGRIVELSVAEGVRIEKDAVVARLDARDVELALRRARAERQQADAQRRLLLAGARPEEIRQAEAQRDAAAADLATARDEMGAAERDFERFDALLAANAGSRKQRDDALTRRDVAQARVRGAEERVRSATEVVNRVRAGARSQEIEAAAARVAAVDAQIASIAKSASDAVVRSPLAGVVTEKLVDAGEIVRPGTPLAIVADLDHAWANVYIGEPDVPKVKLGQPATLFTDAGGPGIPGTITFIASKAEFTPRNVQTAEERSKLVYRLKITVDNRQGVLKQGMPVEAEIPFTTQPNGTD